MDLICPSCQKRLTIEDRYAGMVVKCPMCGSMLQAPVLLNAPAPPPQPLRRKVTPVPAISPVAPAAPAMAAPPPVPAPPPAPAPAPATMPEIGGLPQAAPSTAPPPPVDVVEVIAEPTPSIQLGEYKKSVRWHLRQDILEWIVPGCVGAIFFLSFFSWYLREDYGLNLWELAFTGNGYAIYTFYTVVFIFLTLPAAGVVLALEKRWIPVPAGLQPFWKFRSLILGGMIALPFLFLLGDYVALQFVSIGTRAAIALKLAFRIHLLAVIASGLQFWLEQRKAAGSPLPRLTFRW